MWPEAHCHVRDFRAILTMRLSLCPSPLPRFQQRCVCTSRTMGESISTIQRSPRISTSYNFAAPQRLLAAADGLADGSRQTSPLNGIERSLSRAVVPNWAKDYVSARLRDHVSNSVIMYTAQGRLRKDIRPLSKLFSKAEPLPFEKEKNINLVYSSCLKHANEMLLVIHGRLTIDQRTQSFHFPIVIHQSLDPAARALKRQAPCLYMHSSTRQAQNASTRRVYYAPSR